MPTIPWAVLQGEQYRPINGLTVFLTDSKMLLFISINKNKNQLVISIDRLIFIPFKPLETFFNFCIDFFPFLLYNYKKCRCGGIGRHKGLKIPRSNIRTGSSPVSGTRYFSEILFCFREFFILKIFLLLSNHYKKDISSNLCRSLNSY